MNAFYERFVARINLKDTTGTAFLISQQILLTAFHTVENFVDSNTTIKLEFDNLADEPIETEATLLGHDENTDVALLKIEEPLNIEEHFHLIIEPIQGFSTWSTFGFASGKLTAGATLNGVVTRTNVNLENTGYELDLDYLQKIENIKGLSGAPLVINSKTVGIITKELDGSLGAVSIYSIKSLLDKHKVEYLDNESDHANNESNTAANLPVIEELLERITKIEAGYLFLKGSPGSGKTTIIQTIESQCPENIELQKYLIREENSENLIVVRASQQNLFEWLEEVIFSDLFHALPNKTERNTNQWIETINSLFTELSSKYEQLDKKFVILIDGIEELITSQTVDAFFQALPLNLPRNILIVIAGQNEETLPKNHKNKVIENIIEVTPLPNEECLSIVDNELPALPITIKIRIVDKSEHHPLYLRYITEYIKCNQILSELDDINQWLDTLPKVEGSIQRYYSILWQDIETNNEQLHFISIVARLREGIAPDTLSSILPATLKVGFNVLLKKLSHLLNNNEKVSIYHSSLAEFIAQQSSSLDIDIHSQISEFCLSNKDNKYSQRNILYHLLLSSPETKGNTINHCNQEWADNCLKQFIEPELILADLRLVLTHYLEQNNFIAVIKLLLLSQRIKFRYNQILALHAAEMTEYMIAIEQPAQALKHAFRQSIPLVSIEAALYFQYKLVIQGNEKENKQLFHFIRKVFLEKFIANNIHHSDIVEFYTSLSINNCLLAANPTREYREITEGLMRFLSGFKVAPEQKQEIILSILSHNIGLLILHRNFYTPISELTSRNIPLDSNYTYFLANAYSVLKSYQKIAGTELKYDELTKDIEYSLQNFGYHEEQRVEIVEKLGDIIIDYDVLQALLQDYQFVTIDSMTGENGVDLNPEWYDSILEKSKINGFLANKQKLPTLTNISAKEWENSIKSIIEFTGFLTGQIWQFTTQSKSIEALAEIVFTKLIPILEFNLSERTTFEHSYYLPEDIFPNIYGSLLDLLLTFAEERDVKRYLDFVLKHADNQFGLYSEGFRNVITVFANKLINNKAYKPILFKLLKKLEEHVLLGVHNRWERCEELIFLATKYSQLGSGKRADETFQELLNASMGPDWYKEEQLTLIQSALKTLQTHNIDWSVSEVAATLQYADGEMTFQRYVRMEKEQFIGSLCANNKLKVALEYFKDQSLPNNHEKIINRVEANQIDKLDVGKGYDKGVNYIDEQNAILEIVQNTQSLSSCLKWALCELFIIGDDRYLHQFATIFAEILNNESNAKSPNLTFYLDRIMRILISDMTKSVRNQFVEYLKDGLTANNYALLETRILKSKIELTLPKDRESKTEYSQPEVTTEQIDKEGLFLPGLFGKQSGIEQFENIFTEAKEAMEIEDEEQATTKLIESLHVLQESGWGLWSHNLKYNDDAFNQLIKIAGNKDTLKLLGPLILSEQHETDWRIADKLISIFKESLNKDDAKEVHSEIMKHVKIMVNPPTDTINAYQWMNSNEVHSNTDGLIVVFLLSFFEHPTPVINKRLAPIIKGFAKVYPEIIFPELINQALTPSSGYTAEVCSGIIWSLAIDKPELVAAHVNISSNVSNILSTNHLIITHTWLSIAQQLNIDGALAQEIKAIQDNIFTSTNIEPKSAENEISANKQIDQYVGDLLTQLKAVGAWESSDYALIEPKLKQINQKYNLNSLEKAGEYIARGFHIADKNSYFTAHLITAINHVILSKISNQNIDDVILILRQFNPLFPDASIRLHHCKSMATQFESFIEQNHNNPMCFLTMYDYEILHHIEFVVTDSLSPENSKYFEIESYLFTNNRELIKAKDFFSNQYPIIEKSSNNNNANSSSIFMHKLVPNPSSFGGGMTASFLNSSFKGFPSDMPTSDYKRLNWTEERSWNNDHLGRPLREGCALVISSKVINLLASRGLHLVWHVTSNDMELMINRTTKQIEQLR